MICRKEDATVKFPPFKRSNTELTVCQNEISWSCNYRKNYIHRQQCVLYAQANILAHRFYSCSDNVQIILFKTYCTLLCTAHLWTDYSAEAAGTFNDDHGGAVTVKCLLVLSKLF